MDQKTVEKLKNQVEKTAEESDIDIQQILLFGSRARNDFNEDSDADLILISNDFEGVNWFKRPKEFYLDWDYEELPRPEILCYTPEEFEERKKKAGDIAKTAAEEGIEI